MGEAGGQIVTPSVGYRNLGRKLLDSYSMSKKRGLPFHSSNMVNHNISETWNAKCWDWDSVKFIASPVQCSEVKAGSSSGMTVGNEAQNRASFPGNPGPAREDDENLLLKLGGGDGTVSSCASGETDSMEGQPVSRPVKRVRSGSPGGANYPVCQVDSCNVKLSTAKDYHRRHKVCEVHSKASEALVGRQTQRFCQQCSRFHPLTEFDEGKRSCRRRLAGHNRRRRKTHQDESTPPLVAPQNHNNNFSDVDIVNLLVLLSRAQGNNQETSGSLPDKNQLIQILSNVNSLSLPENLASQLKRSIPTLISTENQNQFNKKDPSPSTQNLLGVLSPNSGVPTPNTLKMQSSQPSTEGSDSEKTKSSCVDESIYLNLHGGLTKEFPSVGGERSSTSDQSPMEEVVLNVDENYPSLHLQLFRSSSEDHWSRKWQPDGNILSSSSSNPSKGRSPLSSPPVVHDFFAMQSSREKIEDSNSPDSEGEVAYGKASMRNCYSTSLQLFGGSINAGENGSTQSSPDQVEQASNCGSDHSPSSLNSDPQDRTGRIIFKLFDKDPSHLPGLLRNQIYNWLSNSPSEMESYIRPGCVVLSLYISMPVFAWDQLEEKLLNFVKSLASHIDVQFWGNGRFLVHTNRQMVSFNEGKIRLFKSLQTQVTPKLISVSPLAVVGGQETSLLLRGRSLMAPGTKIHCTHAASYYIRQSASSSSSSFQDTTYDEIILGSFKVDGAASNEFGRFYIEVENSLRGTSFPVIIADKLICEELRLLEPEIDGTAEVSDGFPTDHSRLGWRLNSQEKVIHFLNELGWLFQRKHNSFFSDITDYGLSRLKFLLIFSVEHDFCTLVKALLDILSELNFCKEGLVGESLQMLSEINLLNGAVKRRCPGMVTLLIHYSVIDPTDTSEKYIFLPNLPGPGGITPLHLAACTSYADAVVDALTSDPLQVGLQSWDSVLDANGLSPYAYALMGNNHSYNSLVAQKLVDRRNGQISILVENENENENGHFQVEMNNDKKPFSYFIQGQQSCSRCAVVASYGYTRKFPGSQGLLYRPYIHSILAIAAVCVCVCLLLRGRPDVGCVSPFAWENLDYGSI